MHYKALRRKRDLLAHTLKVETEGGRETEMRRAHGHRTSTFIICYGTTLNCLADSHRFKMRIYSLVYQTLTLAFMATGFQTVKPYPLINQMLQPSTLPTKNSIYFYDCVVVVGYWPKWKFLRCLLFSYGDALSSARRPTCNTERVDFISAHFYTSALIALHQTKNTVGGNSLYFALPLDVITSRLQETRSSIRVDKRSYFNSGRYGLLDFLILFHPLSTFISLP